MATGNHVVYLRVSTDRQGASGLGIEAQRQAVAEFLNGGKWKVVKEFVEVESGGRDDRPELAKAIEACRAYGARLVIAKLDRLSRDAHFLLGLDKAGVDFVAADMPNANRLTVGIMAMVAEEERRMISARTKAALQAAKARGTKLGGYRGHTPTDEMREAAAAALRQRTDSKVDSLAPIIAELRAAGITSATGLAKALTERGVPTARGGSAWSTVQVQRVLARLL
ncbi:recombinase family protein [Methylorubrum extorquens]|uniref:Resolvase domain protein n=1 Tax=Methylorubrum extorquens DSM 13060 TaxID=882800 RepID=H1KG92_METEX|nr:recombinase family protein [Methylorubrum extorquens]EHP93433.1 Resolvase domain protein [Methylorubrum extorquens DSM 13060]